MKKLLFKEYCTKCNSISVFIKIDNKEFCPDVHLFGISFIGGARFYTFREILKTLGLKKEAIVCKCKMCNTKKIQCPHCGKLLNTHQGKKEKCNNCNKTFYVCV